MKIDLQNGLWNGIIISVMGFGIGLLVWSTDLNIKPVTFKGLIWGSVVVFIIMTVIGAFTGNFRVKKDEQ